MINVCITQIINTAIEAILVKETLLFYYSRWRCIAFSDEQEQ